MDVDANPTTEHNAERWRSRVPWLMLCPQTSVRSTDRRFPYVKKVAYDFVEGVLWVYAENDDRWYHKI